MQHQENSSPERDIGECEKLLTAKEVADWLRIASKKIYYLPITQIRISDRRVRFAKADVQAYIERSKRGGK